MAAWIFLKLLTSKVNSHWDDIMTQDTQDYDNLSRAVARSNRSSTDDRDFPNLRKAR